MPHGDSEVTVVIIILSCYFMMISGLHKRGEKV